MFNINNCLAENTFLILKILQQLKTEQKAWKKKSAENKEINKERRALMKQFKSSEVRLSPEEIKRVQARFSKLGIESDSLSTNMEARNEFF